jgi:hypothetical protein
VQSGGGSVSSASVVTDASGIASSGWTLGKTVGANVLTATSGALAAVTFNATADAGPPAVLVISAGNNQAGNPGTVLPIAPSVIVQDANGNLKPGIVVTFAVGTGGGSVAGGTATSNAAGIAAVTSWTLGPNAGNNTLVASAAGVPSVTFNAVATSPKCSVRGNHVFGSTTQGTLEVDDCQFSDGSFVDFYTTTLGEANMYFFKQTSAAFDAYLLLALADGTAIAENDDEVENVVLNSTIKALLPPGNYILGPGSLLPAKTGSYSLSSSLAPMNNGNCELVFTIKKVSTTQAIETTDCLIQQGPFYADAYFILLRAGQSITVSMSSTSVDSFLQLVRNNTSTPLVQNDNRDATTQDAQITFTATATDYYAIFARTTGQNQTGAYTLSIQ